MLIEGFSSINVGSLNSRKVQKVLAIKFEEVHQLVDKIVFCGGWEVFVWNKITMILKRYFLWQYHRSKFSLFHWLHNEQMKPVELIGTAFLEMFPIRTALNC